MAERARRMELASSCHSASINSNLRDRQHQGYIPFGHKHYHSLTVSIWGKRETCPIVWISKLSSWLLDGSSLSLWTCFPLKKKLKMNLNYTSSVPQLPAQRSTSFFIEDILLHKPKPLREVFHHAPFPSTFASRVPLLDYGYPLMPTPILAPHPHHPLHKPDTHPYFFASGEYHHRCAL